MKKIYNAPRIEVIEQAIEPIMNDTSIVKGDDITPTVPGGDLGGDAKGGFFEDLDDWDGWN